MREVFKLPTTIQRIIDNCHQKQQVLVLATGVFDLFHAEHLRFLQSAKQAGDCLLVGVETDARVKQLKGLDRPVNDEQLRLNQVAKTGVADGVFLLPKKFDQPENHLQLIKLIRPFVLAVSASSPNLVQKRNIMKTVGGVVKVVHQHNPHLSTSQIIQQSNKDNNN